MVVPTTWRKLQIADAQVCMPKWFPIGSIVKGWVPIAPIFKCKNYKGELIGQISESTKDIMGRVKAYLGRGVSLIELPDGSLITANWMNLEALSEELREERQERYKKHRKYWQTQFNLQ